MMMAALSTYHAKIAQVVLVGPRDDSGMVALMRELTSKYDPFAVVVPIEPGSKQTELARMLPFIGSMDIRNGRATAYVCTTLRARTRRPIGWTPEGCPVQFPAEWTRAHRRCRLRTISRKPRLFPLGLDPSRTTRCFQLSSDPLPPRAIIPFHDTPFSFAASWSSIPNENRGCLCD